MKHLYISFCISVFLSILMLTWVFWSAFEGLIFVLVCNSFSWHVLLQFSFACILFLNHLCWLQFLSHLFHITLLIVLTRITTALHWLHYFSPFFLSLLLISIITIINVKLSHLLSPLPIFPSPGCTVFVTTTDDEGLPYDDNTWHHLHATREGKHGYIILDNRWTGRLCVKCVNVCAYQLIMLK